MRSVLCVGLLYKLYFKNGLAYQYSWWTKPPGARVLAESKRAYNREAGVKGLRQDFGFFVMSMSRDIYMMKQGDIGKGYRTFHSAYLAGDTIMAAGSMLIERGVIKGIRNDSGHYHPTASQTIALLQALRMLGVNLTNVDMYDYDNIKIDKAPKFFHDNAKWDLLLQQRDATAAQNRSVARSRPRPGVKAPAEEEQDSFDYSHTPS